MRRGLWILLALAGALSLAEWWFRPIPRTYEPERLDVALNVLADGSIEVQERSELTFKTPSQLFRRAAPVWRHDGVSAVSGSMDGVEFPSGSGPGQLEVRNGPALDATWHFASAISGTHVLVLKYRAANAVETSGIRGTVSWRVLDVSHVYEPAITCVTLTIPDTAVILENPGIEEPGLGATTERRDGHDAMCAVVSDCCSFTRRATFTIDTMTAGEPAWQYHERRARDLMPAFVSGGLFLLVIGAGVLGMIRLKYPPWRIRQDATGDGPALPADIEAALATDRYPKHLKPAMIATGLIDAERSNVARDLGRAAIATLVLGVLTWIVAVTWFGHLGPWPLSIPIGILFSAGMFWLGARRMPILSQRGVLARDRVLYSARVRDGQPKA